MLTDAHVHINEYGKKLPVALEQIREHSIRTLAVSMDIPSFHETLRIAASEPLVIPSFGIHPWNAWRYAKRMEELTELLEIAPAIGEIGLDHRFEKDPSRFPSQYPLFDFFLEAAERTGKLVNLHTSGAESQILNLLKLRKLPAIIVHWYSGPLHLVQDYLELGAYFTIGADIETSGKSRKLARDLPENQLLTETDNPGGWEWLYGDTGFPVLIDTVEAELAQVRGVSQQELSESVSKNFSNVLKAGGISI
ncbi:MAG TPA: TatD family hydrolase [Balneolaceae bacterium]|nr:TatD family hydrolase [Balneolaceae bacterium]